MAGDLPRRASAEATGTLLLVATVVGSGIMGERLGAGAAVALLANSLATGAVLSKGIPPGAQQSRARTWR